LDTTTNNGSQQYIVRKVGDRIWGGQHFGTRVEKNDLEKTARERVGTDGGERKKVGVEKVPFKKAHGRDMALKRKTQKRKGLIGREMKTAFQNKRAQTGGKKKSWKPVRREKGRSEKATTKTEVYA